MEKSSIFILILLLIFPNMSIAGAQASADTLTVASAVAENLDTNLNSVIYAGGTYTAVGEGGRIVQSADGMSWSKISTPSSNAKISWRSIAFTSSTYVAVGVDYSNSTAKAKVIVSTDGGGTWSDKSSSVNADILQKVRYINGTFYAAGGRWSATNRAQDLGVIYSSADGQNWSQWSTVPALWPAQSTTSSPFFLTDIITFNGKYVITGNVFASYAHSGDGSSWTSAFLGGTFGLDALAVYNGKLYVSKNWENGYVSSDGMTFAADSSYDNMLGVVQTGSLLYRYGREGKMYTSSNSGGAWTAAESVTNHTIISAASNGPGMVLITKSSHSLVVTSDQTHWVRFGGNLQGSAYNGSKWEIVGNVLSNAGSEVQDSIFMSSSSGWDQLSVSNHLLPKLGFAEIAYGNNVFVAAGRMLGISGDGENWTVTALPAGAAGLVKGLAYGTNGFVAVTSNNVLQSADGVSWAVVATLSGASFNHVKVVNGVYVAFGDGGIWASTNGTSWSSLDSLKDYEPSSDFAFYDITYANGKYAVMATNGNDGTPQLLETSGVLSGSSVWTKHGIDPDSAWTELHSIDYGNGYYVAAGIVYNDQDSHVVYSSKDLVTWTQYDEQALGVSGKGLNQVRFQNDKFYIVGNDNTRIVLDSGVGATPEATPAAVIDYTAEQLTGLTPGGAYTVNGQPVTADSSGKLAIAGSWLGTPLSIVKKGDGSATTDSVAQTLNVPSRPAAPAGVAATDETAIQAKDGTLTNVTTAMEYRKATAGAWTDVTGTTVTDLAPGVYEVRTKATATAFTSASAPLTVTSFAATAEVTPIGIIDYAAELLTGLIPNALYTVNGSAITTTADGALVIDSSWLGSVLNIVKTGNGVTTTDSAAQVISVPVRQAAPVGVSVTDVTYNGANDGTLQNLTVQMEYRIGDADAWTEVTDTTITGLAPGTYYVRVKATSTDFASAIAQVMVHDSDAMIPAAPEVVADDLNNTIAGLNTSMEFSVDEGPFVRYDGTNLPDLSGEHTVKVRVAASGSVPAGPATTLTFTTNVLIPAGDLAVSASDPSGAERNGYTQIKVTPAPADGHKLLSKNFGAGSIIVPNVGELLTGYTLVGSEGLIPAADGDTLGIAEVDADGKVVKYGSVIAVVAMTTPVTPTPDPVSPGSGTPSGNPASTVTDVIVLVNGKEENAGKATTTTSGNVRTTTIAVDPARLQAKLDAEGNGAVVTIPMMLDSNVIVGELSGQMIKNMENVAATLVLQTSKGSYTLPASEINIGALAARLGNGVKLEDITLRITIGEASAAMNQVVSAAAGRGGLTLAAPILDFTVTASSGATTVELNRFNAYVSRTVALPQGVNPNRLTTGIVVDPDGTVRHVPTRIIQKDGKYYTEIHSLTNSTYSVVWHPLTFADVEKHWAKNAVNDMGSRLVINGVNESTFNPNADITRAEFAAIIVRGLGLKLGEEAAKFADVPANSWYAAAVGTASGAGLITGFEDGTFRPGDRITREQAMNILAKAMKLTGLAEQTGTVNTAGVLAGFTDASRTGAWAKDSLALAASAGLITGRGGNKLEAQANVTRAEVAVLIQRLLQKSKLID
ncbi:S-layer homology domain-containing protein [Paenibacillus sp. FSL R7-0204]|uniref:S-layer homology domain-containing protein n=1 Tax=Paenibacillus sp. FSL R7-0204 TaxID=2921675 RepID=UPI0030FC44E0